MKKLGYLLLLVVAFLLNMISFLGAAVFYVSNPQEFQNALNTAVSNGEDEGTRYCPTDPVTRAQMAAFLYRAFLQ